MLSNFQLGDQALLQSFLVGQPELRDDDAGPADAAAAAARDRLVSPRSAGQAETQAYIEHRLNHVGWKGDPQFEPAAFDLIHTVTGGIPRRINTLCNRLLLAGFLGEKHAFDTGGRAGDRTRDPRGARSGGVARRGADDDTRKRRRRHRRVTRAAIRARCSAHLRGIEERIERLEKTVGAAVDLLHRLLHPRTRDEARRAGRPLMGEILRPLGSARLRRRRAAELHEDGAAAARVRAHARGLPGVVLVHTGPALRRRDERAAVRGSRAAGARHQSRGRLGHARGADGRGDATLRAGARRLEAELRDRRRRRQFDARVQPGRQQEAHAGRARRGRTAQLRPRHAGRDQPRPHRPDRRPALHDRARRGGQPCARRHRRRAHRIRRQRDDRFAAAAPAARDIAGRARLREAGIDAARIDGADGFGVVTLHRPSNVDSPTRSREALGVARATSRSGCRWSGRCTRARGPTSIASASLRRCSRCARSPCSPPQGYLEMLGLLAHARARAHRFRRHPGGDDGARRAVPDDARQHRAADHGRAGHQYARRPRPRARARGASTTSSPTAASAAACPSCGTAMPPNGSRCT